MPFSDITNKDVAICDDDQADIDELDVGRGGSGCFLNGGVFIDMMEDGGDMLGMSVENIFNVKFILCKLLGNDVSIGVKNSLQDDWDGAGEDVSIWVDEVGKVCIIDSCVDFLDDGTLDEVAEVEFAYILMVLADGVIDLVFFVSSSVGRRYWMSSQAVKCGRGVNTVVCGDVCNNTNMSQVTSSEAAWDRLTVCMDLFLELG